MVMSTAELEQVQGRGRAGYDDDDYDDDYDDDDDEDEEDEDERLRGRRQGQYDRRGRKKNDVNPDTKRIMRILMIVAGVVIALLVLFLVANAAGFFSGPGIVATEEETVKVPDVRGMTYEEAEKELKKHDLGIKKASEEEPSNDYSERRDQEPEAGRGREGKKNSTVTVVISSGEAAERCRCPM